MNAHEPFFPDSDHSHIADSDLLGGETNDSYPYDSDSDPYQETSNPSNPYDINHYPHPHDSNPNPYPHHEGHYSYDFVESVNHQRLGSEENARPMSDYTENEVIVYTDSNGDKHTGLILDKTYSGGCDHYEVQRADGSIRVDTIGLADIKGKV